MNQTASNGMKKAARGFSLIELMVSVAIVGLLVGVALPSYTSHIARGKRAEVRAALLEDANFLESHFTTHGFYSTAKSNSTAPTLPLTAVPGTGTANYTITAAVSNAGYTITAKAVNSMAKDDCGDFTLTNTGTQGVGGTLGVADCWNR